MGWLGKPHLCYTKKHQKLGAATKVIDRGKPKKKLNEVKPVENKYESCEFSSDKSHAKGKLQDHAYEWQNSSELKEDNPSQRNCQHQLCHPSLSHIEHQCQESFVQGKTHI